MSNDYLNQLGLSKAERQKLTAVHASGPAELLALMHASPDAFDNLLGESRAQEISKILKSMISDDERAILQERVPAYNVHGAKVGKESPEVEAPKYDIHERDALFDELQKLRHQKASTPETRERITELENQLNRMLEG